MKRSRSKKINWLDRDALPPLPYLTLCLSKKEYTAVCRHLNLKNPLDWLNAGADATLHTVENAGKRTCIVCIKINPARSIEQVFSLLVHEAVHVWQGYRDDMIREHNPSSELEAYVIQGISQSLMIAYSEQRHG
jgi:hypothetical protein